MSEPSTTLTALLHRGKSIRASTADLVPSAETTYSVGANLDLTARTTSHTLCFESLDVFPISAHVWSTRCRAAEHAELG
jgi:hypothetical protein